MEQVTEERYVFHTDWFDKQAELIRSYLLTFYPGDNSIDMVSLSDWPIWHWLGRAIWCNIHAVTNMRFALLCAIV